MSDIDYELGDAVEMDDGRIAIVTGVIHDQRRLFVVCGDEGEHEMTWPDSDTIRWVRLEWYKELRSENARLREALEEIANVSQLACVGYREQSFRVTDIANNALKAGKEGGVMTKEEINGFLDAARAWMEKHQDHVDSLIENQKDFIAPSAEDLRFPYLWKPVHWRWFVDYVVVDEQRAWKENQ